MKRILKKLLCAVLGHPLKWVKESPGFGRGEMECTRCQRRVVVSVMFDPPLIVRVIKH